MKDWGFGNDKPPKRDPITQPAHYTSGKIETVHAIALLGLDYLAGNVVKYISRHKMKGGREDLMKAREYINIMLENYDQLYGDTPEENE
jgi:hypothetical protein